MFTTIASVKLKRLEKLKETVLPMVREEATRVINGEYHAIVDSILRSVGRHVQEIVNAAIAEETARQDPMVREVIKAMATDAAEEAGSAHYQMLKEELDAAATLGTQELNELKADLNDHALRIRSLNDYIKLQDIALSKMRRDLNAMKPKKKPAAKKAAPKKAKKK